MNDHILFLFLKGLISQLLNFFRKKSLPIPLAPQKRLIEEIMDPTEASISSEPSLEGDPPLFSQKGSSILEKEIPTDMVVDPKKVKEQIKNFALSMGGDSAEVDKIIQNQIQTLQERYDKWQKNQHEIILGLIPDSDGVMTEEAWSRGLKKLKEDRPELFDPHNQAMMKNWRETYFIYYDPLFPDERKTKFSEMMLDSRNYISIKIDDLLASQLSWILQNHLRGKSFTIFTGSPILPKEEVVSIIDLDPDDQKIIFKTMIKDFKLFTSYYDFFYHKKKFHLSDAERILTKVAPGVTIPGTTENSPANLGIFSKLFRSGAKV